VTHAASLCLGGRYVLAERLALGGMGEVWRAEDQVLGRAVAIKILREEHASDPEFRRRFRAEAQHAAMLIHPNVAQVYDFGEGDDASAEPPYLVMELIPGEPLSTIIAREAPLDTDATWSILGQASSALSAAHAAGLVHRDIKPANLLVCPDGTLKVTDFGIARATGAAAITSGGDMMFGTPHYISPEQVSGEPVTAASDFYALGVVAYECLTGQRMYDGDPMAVLLAHREQPAPALPPRTPAALRDLVTALLVKDPADRPTDGRAIAAQAERFNAPTVAIPLLDEPYPSAQPEPGAEEPATPATGVLPPPPSSRRRWPLVAAGLVIAAALAGAAVLVVRHDGGQRPTTHAVTVTRPIAVHVASVQAVAPSGSQVDHPEEAHLATDGDPSTAWYTQHYASADFGALRSGSGLAFDLGQSVAVRTLTLQLAVPGVSVQVKTGSSIDAAMTAAPVASTNNAGSTWAVHPDKAARYWVVWFTRLAPSDGAYRAGIFQAAFAR